MALGLNNVFKQSVLSNAEDGLRNEILLLIANIDVIDGEIVAPEMLSEPRLSQMDSSLFAQIVSADQQVIWRSPSLLEQSMPLLGQQLGEFLFYDQVDWQGYSEIYSMTLGLEWETEQGDVPFTVQISEHSLAYTKRLARYQRTFGLWLAVLGAVLLTLLLFLFGWALKPLRRVAQQVSQIEAGQRQRFDEDYPQEVNRLTVNLNQLLQFEAQRIKRQKEVLGNLAHSLKTPIAVLKGLDWQNTQASEANQQEADSQLTNMQNIIDYQLQSASTIGRRHFHKPIEVCKLTEQIVNSLNKLHKEKALNVLVECDEDIVFYGDQGDWMELAGNLLDNAFKWSNTCVAVRVKNIRTTDSEFNRAGLELIVEDDGNGIEAELKQDILQRGVRLDSQTPGHGLGMHIVKGIVEAYNGKIFIDDAEPNGTQFTVIVN